MPTLYVPLEIFKRELMPKLALAVFMVSRGYRIVIGHKWHVNVAAISSGQKGDLYLFKGLFQSQSSEFSSKLRENGVTVISFDEESGIIYDDYRNYAERYGIANSISDFKHWLTWGLRDYEYLKNNNRTDCNIENIGTPRLAYWDLVKRNSPKILNRKSHQKKYLLFATNFTFDPGYASELTNTLREGSRHLYKVSLEDLQYGVENQANLYNFELFSRALKIVLEYSKLNVHVRPHPIELRNSWSTKLLRLDPNRVFIDRNWDSSESVIGAKAVIHRGSTIGVESNSLGVPSVSIENLDKQRNSILSLNKHTSVLRPDDWQEFGELAKKDFSVNEQSTVSLGNMQMWDGIYSNFYEGFYEIASLYKIDFSADFLESHGSRGRIHKTLGLELFDIAKDFLNAKEKSIDQVKRPYISLRRFQRALAHIKLLLDENAPMQSQKVGPNTFVLKLAGRRN